MHRKVSGLPVAQKKEELRVFVLLSLPEKE